MAKPPKWKYADDSSWLRLHYYWLDESNQVVGEMVLDRRRYFSALIFLLISAGLFWWQGSLDGILRWTVVIAGVLLVLIQLVRLYLIFMIEESESGQRQTFKQVDS